MSLDNDILQKMRVLNSLKQYSNPFTKNTESNKIVALLDFDYSLDVNIKDTLEYYFTNYGDLFYPFPIVNTYFDLQITLDLLNEYYNNGYRYFILTTHSGIIIDLISWFNDHPYALGYTCYAQSNQLNVPKNIYNLTPNNNNKMTLYSYDCILPYDVIYFWWNSNKNEITSYDRYFLFKEICESEGKTFISIPFDSSTDISTEYVRTVMTDIIQPNYNASIIISSESLTSKLYNSFNNTVPNYGYNIFNTGVFPVFDNIQSKEYFAGLLYIINTSQANLNSSYLWNCGYQTLKSNGYGTPVLNCLDMVYGSENDLVVSYILPAHNDVVYFNYITKFAENYSIEILKYILKNNEFQFIPSKIYYDGDDNLIFVSNVENPVENPIIIQPIPPPIGPKKKAIALLELTGGSVAIDKNIVKSIYYYLTSYNIFTPFTIVDTAGSLTKTLELLQKYYDEGFRIFYGFTRSSIIAGVLEWFNSHPDAIGISNTSNANSLAIKKNIYRLSVVGNYYFDSINNQLEETIQLNGKIYYVYSENELTTLDALEEMKKRYGESNIITYPVKSDNSNLNQQELIDFFINTYNVSSIDSIIVFLIIGNQQQIYIDLFYGPLNIPTSQYSVTGNISKINPEITTLNGLFNFQVLTNITKSKLWTNGIEYLGETNFAFNTLNAMYMITSFVNNYDVLSLASYNSCLQFNEFNDVKYGSIAVLVYQDGKIIYKYIYSKDPIYGQLYFTIV